MVDQKDGYELVVCNLIDAPIEVWNDLDIAEHIKNNKNLVVIYDKYAPITEFLKDEIFPKNIIPHLDATFYVEDYAFCMVGFSESMWKHLVEIISIAQNYIASMIGIPVLDMIGFDNSNTRSNITMCIGVPVKYVGAPIRLPNMPIGYITAYPDILDDTDKDSIVYIGNNELVADMKVSNGILDYTVKCYNKCIAPAMLNVVKYMAGETDE